MDPDNADNDGDGIPNNIDIDDDNDGIIDTVEVMEILMVTVLSIH
ncbi:hypothetical protein [Nonlabens sp. Hel1_33_55]|nr:hypothetical protein [Nonlabens sp. Hel1_33_55]